MKGDGLEAKSCLPGQSASYFIAGEYTHGEAIPMDKNIAIKKAMEIIRLTEEKKREITTDPEKYQLPISHDLWGPFGSQVAYREHLKLENKIKSLGKTNQATKQREETPSRLKSLPQVSTIPGQIPWKRTPEDLRALLQALQQGYIANTDMRAIIGHFDIPGSEKPSEMILWKEDQWVIGSLFIALHGAGITGMLRRTTNPTLPRYAAKWAVEHFKIQDGDGWRSIKSQDSFRESWRKRATAYAGNSITFTKILDNLRIN